MCVRYGTSKETSRKFLGVGDFHLESWFCHVRIGCILCLVLESSCPFCRLYFCGKFLKIKRYFIKNGRVVNGDIAINCYKRKWKESPPVLFIQCKVFFMKNMYLIVLQNINLINYFKIRLITIKKQKLYLINKKN